MTWAGSMTSIMRALLYDRTPIKISGKMLARINITSIRVRSLRRNTPGSFGQTAPGEKIGPYLAAVWSR